MAGAQPAACLRRPEHFFCASGCGRSLQKCQFRTARRESKPLRHLFWRGRQRDRF